MAYSFNPNYATASGDSFGYNERSGTSTAVLRDRYEGAIYRGQQEASLAYHNQVKDQKAAPTRDLFATQTQPMPQQQQQQAPPQASSNGDPNASGYGHPVPPIDNRTNPDYGRQTSGFSSTVSMPAPDSTIPMTRGVQPRVPAQPGDMLATQFRARGSGAYSPDNRTADSLGPLGDVENSTRPKTPDPIRPRMSYEREQSAMCYGKESVARRLPEKERLRYHIPGYMGFVRRQQFHHGETYGTTTRKCILGYAEDSAPLI